MLRLTFPSIKKTTLNLINYNRKYQKIFDKKDIHLDDESGGEFLAFTDQQHPLGIFNSTFIVFPMKMKYIAYQVLNFSLLFQYFILLFSTLSPFKLVNK